MWSKDDTESKIYQFDLVSNLIKQDIVEFNISVDDILLMQIIDSLSNLLEDASRPINPDNSVLLSSSQCL